MSRRSWEGRASLTKVRDATKVLALALAVSACAGSVTGSASRSPVPTASPVRAATAFDVVPSKMLVIVLENHSARQALAGMPRLAAAAATYGRAMEYFGVAHPSLPDYLALAGGSTFGITDDDDPGAHRLPGRSVFGQVLAADRTATTYAEGMGSRCQTTSRGRYAVRHNPWVYFSAERAACRSHDLPSGTPTRGALHEDVAQGTLPTFGLLVPDLCHDAHDCSLSTADRWLGRWLDALLAGPDFRAGRLAVVVTFDEDDRLAQNHVVTAVLHPSLRGARVRDRLDHFSLARSVAGLVGRPGLRESRTAPDLLATFGLTATRRP